MTESPSSNSQPTPLSSSLNAEVSVVVPSFNHAPFVEQALRSILRQTLAPRELVVIDDGSSDDSPRIIERVLRDCAFACELIVRPNRGLCATLNEGLRRVRGGRYFAYLGSDDAWLPGFLEARVAALEAHPRAALAYGNAYSIDAEGRIIDCTTDWARYRDGDVRAMLLSTLAPLSPTVLHRRALLERHGWNERARLEDYELYLRLSAEGDFAFDARVLSAWRWHGSNASANLELMLEERLAAQRRVAQDLGIGAEELRCAQALARFRSAEEFARAGQKRRALQLAFQSLSALPAPADAAKMLLRLLIPHSLVKRRRDATRRHALARYNSIQI